MKNLFIIFSLFCSLAACKQETQYYAMFKSRPRVFGNISVFAESVCVGHVVGDVKQVSPNQFMLSIKVDKKYDLLMTSQLCAVVVNGAVELRTVKNKHVHPLQAGASIEGFCTESEYNWTVLGSKGKQLLEQLNQFFE